MLRQVSLTLNVRESAEVTPEALVRSACPPSSDARSSEILKKWIDDVFNLAKREVDIGAMRKVKGALHAALKNAVTETAPEYYAEYATRGEKNIGR